MPTHEQYIANKERYKRQAKEAREKYKDMYIEYDRKRRQRRKEETKQLKRELTLHGCAICGYNKCPAAMDFHHVNPEDKKFTLNATYLRALSEEKLIEELEKCILLCCRCHREIHTKEKNNE
jgi:5-methylcytosine-specific restriction endonuclease McrA